MLTLYSYPTLFGVADNNGYGLKVYAFLKLAGLPFNHEHIFDAAAAPRGQLPYIVDGGETIGDSEAIIAQSANIASPSTRRSRPRSATAICSSRACSMISTGSCPIRDGRMIATISRSAMRSSESTPT
jgi:hypothetical protein